jgi:hypothetical protein
LILNVALCWRHPEALAVRNKALALVALAVLQLACVMSAVQVTPEVTPTAPATLPPSPTPAATVTPQATGTAEAVNTVTIRAVVYIRAEADANSPAVGSLETGERVVIVSCSSDWCEIAEPSGYVWRGCTDDNPNNLSCEAR